MITAIVQFRLGEDVTRDAAKRMFSESGPRYRAVPGLLRKYYLIAEDGASAGGVYLWESRADAERLYTEDWRQRLAEKYGSAPAITYFETPVVVDNQSGEIRES